MRVLLLSRYMQTGASSRYRSYQYLPYLRSQGIHVDVSPLMSDLYLERLYARGSTPIVDVLSSYVVRAKAILSAYKYDLLWIEYEMLPWLPYVIESFALKRKVRYIVDYDDAIFHRYDQHLSAIVRMTLGEKIAGVMSRAALVIAGNEYLAAYARNAGSSHVEIVPTVVDLDRYPVERENANSCFTIGWIGTPMTSRYLEGIAAALRQICRDGLGQVLAVGPRRLDLGGIPYAVGRWSEETEVKDIQSFDVGVMPLVDSPWERGKCGHKLIQYMACSKPVVASPVGVNSEIVEHGVNGFLASTTEEWIEALTVLRNEPSLRKTMGLAGRKKVEEKYSLHLTAPRLAQLMHEIVEV